MLDSIKKYKFDQNFLIQILFNIFPLIMLMPSAFINFYLTTFIIYSYTFLFINKINIKIFFTDYLLFIFFVSSVISTIIGNKSSDYIIIAKSLADIRFFLLFLLIRNLFYYKLIKLNNLLKLSLLTSVFLSLDIFLQFYSGKDIFGFPEMNGRYGGVFHDEAIAGSYIQNFSLLAILATFYLKYKNISNKELFIFLIIAILGTGILMTLDRIPFFIYILSLFILLILIKSQKKIFCLSIIIITLLFFLFYENSNQVKNRYKTAFNFVKVILFHSSDFMESNQALDKQKLILKEKTMHTGIEYYLLFDSALYTFKNNFWLGSGRKSYYKSCDALRKYRDDLLCAPHTHNIYLEILISQGAIGMFFFLSFLIIIFKKNYYDFFVYRKVKADEILILKNFLLVLLALEILPLRPHGNIIQTVSGTVFWFLISVASSKLTIKKLNFNKLKKIF